MSLLYLQKIKHLRQLLFVILFLTSGILFAQNHTYTYHLSLNDSARILYGQVQVSFPSKSYEHTDSLVLHLPPRSMEWKGSLLQQQFIDFQNVNLYYADTEKKGAIDLSEISFDNQKSKECKDCEFVIIPNTTRDKNKDVKLIFSFSTKIPDASFTGTGYDGEVYRLIDWLPRLAVYDTSGWQFNPVTYQNDWYQHKDEFYVNFQLDTAFQIASNANKTLERISENGIKNIQFHLPSSTTLQFYLSKNFKVYSISDSISLYTTFNDPYLPAILPSLNEKINNFFLQQIGPGFSQSFDLVILKDKIGEFQSNGVLSINYPKTTFDFASNLAHARAEQLFRYDLAPNGFKDVWMARGLPYFYKYQFIQNEYPDKKWLPFSNSIVGRFLELDEFDYDYQNHFLMLYISRQGLDQTMDTPADSLSKFNYEAIVQAKTYLGLGHMQEYMGKNTFKRSMRKFFIDNKDKEGVSPTDLKKSFQFFFFRDVDWFFNDLVTTNKEHDYKLVKTDYCPTISTATIRNTQQSAIPFSLTGIKDGEEVITEWFPGHTGKKDLLTYHDDFDQVIINKHRTVPEFSQKNNQIRTKGIFKRIEPVRLQFFNSFENPDKTQIYWLPSGNFNAYDKLLMGVTLHNRSVAFVRKPFEYRISPEFSTGTGKLTGYASGLFNFAPTSGPFHRISTGVYARYNHYDQDLAFFRLSPSLNLFFRRNYAASNIIQKMRFRAVWLERELRSGEEVLTNEINNASYLIFAGRYSLENINVLKPYTITTDLQVGDLFSSLSTTADFRWMLPNRRWLIWRNFGGVFLNNSLADKGVTNNYYSMGLSGTRDYLFDYELIGRSDESGLWSQQFFITDGGFKSKTDVFSDNFMLTSNLNVPIWNAFNLYGISPSLGLFGDVGVVDDWGKVYWDYGMRISFFTDFMELYLPVQNQDQNFIEQKNYLQNVRFVLNLDISEIIERVRRGYY